MNASYSLANSRWAPAIILLLTFVCFTAPKYWSSLKLANGLPVEWASANFWISSADCARKTGAILVFCKGDRIVPIADVSPGDDPGQPLALDLYSIITQKPINPDHVSLLNSTLNYVGITLLALLLFCLRLPVVSFLILTMGALIANQIHSTTPHPGHFGVAGLAAILPLAILGLPLANVSRRIHWGWVILGVGCLSSAMLFREAIGLMGIVAGLFAVCASYFISGPRTGCSILAHLGLASLVVVTIAVPGAILKARDVAYELPESANMEQHGTWHNLYIGLGSVPNAFGIEWNDSSGAATVKRIDPKIAYTSKDYYSALRQEYFRIVQDNPAEVARIYFEKLSIALKTYNVWKIVFVVFCLALFVRLRQTTGRWIASDAVLAISLIFIGTFIGQAMLIHFSELYLFPVKLFLLLGIAVIVDILLKHFLPPQLGRPLSN